MPLALLAITYFSDAYQDARSRKLAEGLNKQAKIASSWGQAQALLSRANGLSSGDAGFYQVQTTGPVGGLMKLQLLVIRRCSATIGIGGTSTWVQNTTIRPVRELIDNERTRINQERARQSLAAKKNGMNEKGK